MKLVTFGIDDQRNLIIYLILYQMETDPVPVIDKNKKDSVLHIFENK